MSSLLPNVDNRKKYIRKSFQQSRILNENPISVFYDKEKYDTFNEYKEVVYKKGQNINGKIYIVEISKSLWDKNRQCV